MKFLIIGMLLLAGCKKGPECTTYTIIGSDNGDCWRKCAQAAAASEYYTYNRDRCIRDACNYPTEERCK